MAAVCDSDIEKAAALASFYNVPSLSEDQIFADSTLEAVVIASLAPLHIFHAKKALQAGKHVYIEKPMALTVRDAQTICSLAKETNRILMVGHILNYHPAFIKLKELLPQLGPLKHIYANRLSLGRFRHQESVLWDLASHDVSLILSLVNEMPLTISPIWQSFITPDVPASALLNLTFSKDLTAHIHASWLSPFKEQKLVVIGEKGITVFDDCKPWDEKLILSKGCYYWNKGQIEANTQFQAEPIPLPEAEPLKNECLHFLTSIKTGKTPLTSGEEGLRVTHILEIAENSLKERKII
ncbi:MAG: Gfo/Idh/MocA family oxidoreductase [Alphaproteobacteria bacterium]|nr:Gfo/Idh/MocA family oxidoreductase [Alphaproteobacteria bacterium]